MNSLSLALKPVCEDACLGLNKCDLNITSVLDYSLSGGELLVFKCSSPLERLTLIMMKLVGLFLCDVPQ